AGRGRPVARVGRDRDGRGRRRAVRRRARPAAAGLAVSDRRHAGRAGRREDPYRRPGRPVDPAVPTPARRHDADRPEARHARMNAVQSTITLQPMRWWHIDEAMRLDADLFGPEQWSVRMMWGELAQVTTRYYLIAVEDGRLIGYGGLAALGDEGFIQTL